MRRAAALALVFLSAAAVARAKVAYEVPIDWVRIETRGDYEEAYQTSLDASKRVFVLVRRVDSEGASAFEWARLQSSAMKREGVVAGPPLEQHFGATAWWYVDWKNAASGERGRRYFLDAPAVAEVSLLARDDVFKSADASQFDAFFASFSA